MSKQTEYHTPDKIIGILERLINLHLHQFGQLNGCHCFEAPGELLRKDEMCGRCALEMVLTAHYLGRVESIYRFKQVARKILERGPRELQQSQQHGMKTIAATLGAMAEGAMAGAFAVMPPPLREFFELFFEALEQTGDDLGKATDIVERALQVSMVADQADEHTDELKH